MSDTKIFRYFRFHLPTNQLHKIDIEIGPDKRMELKHRFEKFPTNEEVFLQLLKDWNMNNGIWLYGPLRS
jgi:hypothetical protein